MYSFGKKKKSNFDPGPLSFNPLIAYLPKLSSSRYSRPGKIDPVHIAPSGY
jgi:hypothetical protein